MKIFSYMERGFRKERSEDTILVDQEMLKEGYQIFDCQPRWVAVADGVGGNAGGCEASEYVISQIAKTNTELTRESIFEINDGLIAYAKSVPGKEQMATTFSGICFQNSPYKIIHVGNTRIFAIRGSYLKQLTTDHTTVEWLRARGEYESAAKAPGNEITACFGSGSCNRLQQLSIVDIERNYTGYVLTSDGLHDHVDVEDLEDFLGEEDYSEEALKRLGNKARENGSEDDISIVIIRLGD